jgi:hypothetical protein
VREELVENAVKVTEEGSRGGIVRCSWTQLVLEWAGETKKNGIEEDVRDNWQRLCKIKTRDKL